MALNINGRMKVKTLKSEFKNEFGLTLRIYDGNKFADDDATLAAIRKGDSKGGEFSPKRNTRVGNLEDKILDMFGIKTKIAGSDDKYLFNKELTLAAAKEDDDKSMERKEKKASKTVSDKVVEVEEETMHVDEDDTPNEEAEAIYIVGHAAGDTFDDDFLLEGVIIKKIPTENNGSIFYLYGLEGNGDSGRNKQLYIDTEKRWFSNSGTPAELDEVWNLDDIDSVATDPSTGEEVEDAYELDDEEIFYDARDRLLEDYLVNDGEGDYYQLQVDDEDFNVQDDYRVFMTDDGSLLREFWKVCPEHAAPLKQIK